MNDDDLISRSALKEATKSFADCDGFNPVWQIIDNAPTVEVPNYSGQIAPDLLRSWGYEKRPTGKWIDLDSMVDKAKCSNCKKIVITEPFGHSKFCPNCGAKMDGGKEE